MIVLQRHTHSLSQRGVRLIGLPHKLQQLKATSQPLSRNASDGASTCIRCSNSSFPDILLVCIPMAWLLMEIVRMDRYIIISTLLYERPLRACTSLRGRAQWTFSLHACLTKLHDLLLSSFHRC